MEKTQEIAVTQMRASVEKQGVSTKDYSDPTILRFLIARSMDPEKAAKMFVQWKKWRDEFVLLGFIPDSEVEDELAAKKVYLQGLSKIGKQPVVVMKANRHFQSKDQLQAKKFVPHLMDKVIASSFEGGKEIGNEKLILIVDMEKLGYKNVDTRNCITGFQLVQAYYPERLAKLFLLNVPWFILSFWKIISPFLDKATLEKIVFVSNEEERHSFIKEIGEDTLPEEYGGPAKLVALQDVTVTTLPTK
ncbi:CRAL-TRIO domain [Macleaya cordata]|uniref:CRAL-TRIO domain n=1 Tax=Macleaya cordata TaxID=56857 RepID=A0A200QNY3_MACCD|nr:CRAL-TRIO domain [Macleaya cordata]